ncbi:MAG: hypothetical protein ACRDJF_05110, partial [Actinomycetota bacterium]
MAEPLRPGEREHSIRAVGVAAAGRPPTARRNIADTALERATPAQQSRFELLRSDDPARGARSSG